MAIEAVPAPLSVRPARAIAVLFVAGNRTPALFSTPYHGVWSRSGLPVMVRKATGTATALIGAIPIPPAIRRHVSRRDAAFIAAAYAIPLPGTALVAVIIVGVRLAYRRFRTRMRREPAILPGHG